ncbi:MAG: RtcB family protein, partial [Planctomycetaceae bacterium]|nr:RtcB family protein [Planctomycetaceae bacterium]
MNARQLEKLGIPRHCVKPAITAVQQLAADRVLSRNEIKERLRQVVESPKLFVGDPVLDALARELLDDATEPPAAEPVTYQRWGSQIDDGAIAQMEMAVQVPGVTGAALMPDAHIGYGLPIGGVLGVENAVIPYAVGVDIACRMKLSVLDIPVEAMTKQFDHFRGSLERGTVFGVGAAHRKPQDHPVLDQDWTVCRIIRESRDRARRQLGTSGSGNHFVEFGVFTLNEPAPEFSLEPGTYVALLSHSGSRGTGAAVCSTYSDIARRMMPRKYEHLGRLAWLDMNSTEGREYWAAMNLM